MGCEEICLWPFFLLENAVLPVDVIVLSKEGVIILIKDKRHRSFNFVGIALLIVGQIFLHSAFFICVLGSVKDQRELDVGRQHGIVSVERSKSTEHDKWATDQNVENATNEHAKDHLLASGGRRAQDLVVVEPV